jgi:demethylmenaquinone methyltransferase/2-methoxy-6-polyprenyl-1,4-benzoquinol methylase
MTDGRLRAAFDSQDAKRRYVRRLFATIADRYDLITILLSYGQDRKWKQRLAGMAEADRHTTALDLACGTGDIAFAVAERGARVTGLDITHRMLQLARLKRRSPGGAGFVTGDMMALPFAANVFDLVTTGYGIRNLPAIPPALDEIYRVLKPGGLFLSLDFDRPRSPFVRAVYLAYLTVVGSSLGLLLHGDPDTYRYIPESIRRYPGATEVASMARLRGFASCEILPVLGGLMAIHRARKGADSGRSATIEEETAGL